MLGERKVCAFTYAEWELNQEPKDFKIQASIAKNKKSYVLQVTADLLLEWTRNTDWGKA